MDLKNVRAIVTGGSSGIGLATAKRLIEEGGRVAIVARHREKLEASAREIGAIPMIGDVSRDEDVKQIVQRAIVEMGEFNVLINNAGFGRFAPLVELPVSDMQEIFATNVIGAMLMGREAARYFVDRQYGNIINIASTAAQRGFAGGTAYCASKFALAAMTECWRAELRKSNVRVMQVNPSEVQTDFVVSSGREARPLSERKLRGKEIADTIAAMLAMDDRGFITDATVWATNPD